MSKFLEIVVIACWLALAANQFLALWADNTFVLATAALAALLALLYEVRERQP